MKRTTRVGIAAGLGLSLGLASLAPHPQAEAIQPSGRACPTIDYTAADHTHGETPAATRIGNLGAFMLGAMDRKCREGQAIITYNGTGTVYSWWNHAYGVSVTVDGLPHKLLGPDAISAFAVRQYQGDVQTASLDAKAEGAAWEVHTRWLDDGVMVQYSGKTGERMTEDQAAYIVGLGKIWSAKLS